jgi:hypothetical protein
MHFFNELNNLYKNMLYNKIKYIIFLMQISAVDAQLSY